MYSSNADCWLLSLVSNCHSFTAHSSEPTVAELYMDWVAPTLQSNLLVETWQNGRGKLPSSCGRKFVWVQIILILAGHTILAFSYLSWNYNQISEVTLGCSKWGNCPWSSVTAEGSTARVKVLTAVLLKIEVFQGCDTVTLGEQFMTSWRTAIFCVKHYNPSHHQGLFLQQHSVTCYSAICQSVVHTSLIAIRLYIKTLLRMSVQFYLSLILKVIFDWLQPISLHVISSSVYTHGKFHQNLFSISDRQIWRMMNRQNLQLYISINFVQQHILNG